jgi:uncharacterized protein (DUF1330 family)
MVTPGAMMGAMTAYLILNYAVDDTDAYKEYQKGAGPALGIGTDCKLLVLDAASEQIEGEGAGHQTVVLEFESREKAQEIYQSAAYQAIVPTRLGATAKHFAVLVDGFTMPS